MALIPYIYKCDLRGVDIREYVQNPIVLMMNNTVDSPVGKAEIRKDRRSILVYFMDNQQPAFAHTVAPAILEVDGKSTGKRVLIYLSVIPILEDVS